MLLDNKVFTVTKEVYAILYNNGEQYDDSYIGISHECGIFETREMAEDIIKRLQIEHEHRIKKEIDDGYVFPSFEHESWEVLPITFHYKPN